MEVFSGQEAVCQTQSMLGYPPARMANRGPASAQGIAVVAGLDALAEPERLVELICFEAGVDGTEERLAQQRLLHRLQLSFAPPLLELLRQVVIGGLHQVEPFRALAAVVGDCFLVA